jgi:hypothetical protein
MEEDGPKYLKRIEIGMDWKPGNRTGRHDPIQKIGWLQEPRKGDREAIIMENPRFVPDFPRFIPPHP